MKRKFMANFMMKTTNVLNLIILQLILLNLNVINGYSADLTTLHRSVRGTCTELQWKCKNGDCIENHQKCDGEINCADKSDETLALCSTVRCPAYAFRCTYGGCITGSSICNGKRDCADNSDELQLTCPGVKDKLNPVGNCEKGYLKCGSGECVSTDNFCDGSPDCKDSSDETIERCVSTYCPSFSFRCAYGGCVGGNAKCNNILDCADGSDETEALCGRPFYIPTTQAPTAPVALPADACLVPQFPKNGRFVQDISRPFEDIVQPREIIMNYNPITVVCDPGYTLNGVDTITCVSGDWDSDFPTCDGEKSCSEFAINGLTVIPKCLFNGKEISCKKPLPLKTKVEISCKLGYGTPDKIVQTLYCVSGSWSADVIKCSTDCGTITQQGESYISGGVDANVAEVPWHAGIYSNRTNTWIQICGGTILSEKIVLSAAHCFWNVEERKFYKEKNYKVGLGKFYRDYTAVEHYPVQFVDIKEIITNERYKHLEGLFNFDIAIIISKNYIIFKNHIRPICLNRGARTSMERTVQPNQVGTVAGWGYTENDSIATNLKVANITSTDYNTCYTRALEQYKPFVAVGDKFCAGSPEKAVSVCRGDSGGGLVFRESLNGEVRYYIRGIVSSGQLALEKQCDTKQYVLFTNVLDYLEMIDEAERKVIFSGGEGVLEARQGM